MSYGSEFVLTLFTNDPELARRADKAGVNRIGIDLERIGKAARQDRAKCWISNHEIHQIEPLLEVLNNASLFARINPIHDQSEDEINSLIKAGVETLMLPMFRTAKEAACFIRYIDGRAKASLLLETAGAAERIEQIVQLNGVDEIHIGLNDLHLDLGLRTHFELLYSDLIATLSKTVRQAGISFGFGGIGRVSDHRLPIPSDLVYAQYPRLQADRALVSRTFTQPDYRRLDLKKEVSAFRKRMDEWYECPEKELFKASAELQSMIQAL